MTTLTVADLLARARSASGNNVAYKLGAGGMDPAASGPANLDNACDCSGFTSWCIGLSRRTNHPLYVKFNGGWINTDAMAHDGVESTGFFTKLDAPKVGCFLVYPSNSSRRSVGHVGIVTAVSGGAAKKIIHCSSGNFRNFGDAIRETDPTVFAIPQTTAIWYEGLL